MFPNKPKVVLAMSGGVDSSVAAKLLLEKGFDVIGVTFQLWPTEENNISACGSFTGIVGAREVADRLEIEHHVVDCRSGFEKIVLRYAWSDYSQGKTPNPCVVCNRQVKFKTLSELAKQYNATSIATGHHARIEMESYSNQPVLKRGKDKQKDQSYFLHRLPPEWLAVTRFPIGDYSKKQVRQIARTLDLPNAEKPESQDACLPNPSTQFAEELRRRSGQQISRGNFVDTRGNVIGQHLGIHRFTIGQRRGLGLPLGHRAFVVEIRPERNEVVIGTADDLFSSSLWTYQVHWLIQAPLEPIKAQVQIRYRHLPAQAILEPRAGQSVRVCFQNPQRAVAPGQAAVFYQGDRLIGGGWIQPKHWEPK